PEGRLAKSCLESAQVSCSRVLSGFTCSAFFVQSMRIRDTRLLSTTVKPMDFQYTEHALMRMDEKEIDVAQVEAVIQQGDIISLYADDRPYPSALYLGTFGGRALHVVAAAKGVDSYIVITAYWPDKALWSDDFRRKKA